MPTEGDSFDARQPDIITAMRRSGPLLAALALVVGGCGTSSPSAPAPTSPADHGDAVAQKAVLTKALRLFRAAGSGTYESEVRADGLSQSMAHETGSFSLDPVASQLERTIVGIDQSSRQPRNQVIRVRASADRHYFLQLKEWGSWTGCWLPMRLSALSKQTGVDMAGSGTLPTAIGVLSKARVSNGGDGMVGPHLAVDAYSALQFLGVSGAKISAQRDELAAVSVPVLLDVTAEGGPSGAKVEGSQVADALKEAGISLSDAARNYVAKAHAQMVLGDLGKPVHVSSPTKAELLPAKPRPESTCPANE